ncbi:histidine kinase [Geobacter hydrogenophilus]|uniref:Histidine kinase n=1 Tax=Geobacter hydrogenophilus TaxID=40983 RepID=A0A9W6FZ40_9BACT|nr:histidine kinase [Geobacter hydrogenophilus]MBT0893559.1 histidine kinase [Geobacter hydrogenophilus]GLI37744.1 histidine kinase [Geobacter hydrogenophilus]
MKKKVLAVSAACALTAATAVPALALENEFHGMFRVFGTISNYNDGGSGQILPTDTGAYSTGVLKYNGVDPKTKSFVEQRARLMYIAKANDDLKLVTHFEIDSRWGDTSYANGRNGGGAVGADTVNFETKNVYLDFNIPSTPMNFKVGIQPIVDSYKGIFINADAAAALATAKLGDGSVLVGFSRLDDADTFTLGSATATRVASTPGKAKRDLYIVDGKYNITKDVKVGASYYLLNVDQTAAAAYDYMLHTVGVNAEVKLAPLTLDGFLLYQSGRSNGADKIDLNGWAANLTAKGKLGPGTLKASFLYASGEQNGTRDDSTYRGITNETSTANGEHSFYESDMMIMFRNKMNITGDRAIVYNVKNVIGGFVGYNANITPKAFANVNAGFVATDKSNDDFGTGRVNGGGHKSNYLGTEINGEVGYKVFDNLTASLQGAYVFLGDYYKDTVGTAANPDDPRNPYVGRIMLNYAF